MIISGNRCPCPWRACRIGPLCSAVSVKTPVPNSGEVPVDLASVSAGHEGEECRPSRLPGNRIWEFRVGGCDELCRETSRPWLTVRPAPRGGQVSSMLGTVREKYAARKVPVRVPRSCERSAKWPEVRQRRRVAGEGGRQTVSLAQSEWAETREFVVEILGKLTEHRDQGRPPSSSGTDVRMKSKLLRDRYCLIIRKPLY